MRPSERQNSRGKPAFVVGTFDTKAEELQYAADLISATGVSVVTVDVSGTPHSAPVDVTSAQVARHHPTDPSFFANTNDRGKMVTHMSDALGTYLLSRNDIGGVLGIGGSGNTALVTGAMRQLPVGVPKVMVSTVASGNVAPYVGPCDICMVYSVTDIAGINRISRTVIGNAAHALAGMVEHPISEQTESRLPLAMTMYGVTNMCINRIRSALETEFDPLVFHATGVGGRAMEKLIESGMVSHVIDVTMTELCHLLVGGIFQTDDDRLGAVIRRGIPYVGSVGAVDFATFGTRDTIPAEFRNRTFYQHNAQITLMRTSIDENDRIGRWIGTRLNEMTGPVRFLLPERGISHYDSPGQHFYDPEADQALFSAIEKTVVQTDARRVVRLPYEINDPAFSDALVDSFREVHGLANG